MTLAELLHRIQKTWGRPPYAGFAVSHWGGHKPGIRLRFTIGYLDEQRQPVILGRGDSPEAALEDAGALAGQVGK